MLSIQNKHCFLTGPAGKFEIPHDDEITLKLAMLYEGECTELGPVAAARKFGFSKPRYFQLRQLLARQGAAALQSRPRGPKSNYRRTEEIVRQIIRHRFLDADASVAVIAQKLRQTGHSLSVRSLQRVLTDFGLQKKLYELNPKIPPVTIPTQRTRRKQRTEPADPKSLERQVRQLLADKISGTQLGLWLLIPEHLRLGTWDLLRGWTGCATAAVQPRLALQLVHEAALCVTGVRQGRSLSQKGFELANGLPFVATDQAIHQLLAAHTVEQAQQLQIALGKLRRASGHFPGHLLALDPHRIKSSSQRQMVRFRDDPRLKAVKVAQTFFCLDAHSGQPICFTSGSSARTVAQATPELLRLAQAILQPHGERPLVMADCEHFNRELIEQVRRETPFDLLIPMPNHQSRRQKRQQLADDQFTRHWAGFATAKRPFGWSHAPHRPYFEITQRSGERAAEFYYKSFLVTADRPEVPDLCVNFPQRWHIEEFFNFNQALGWQRAGTLNLNIRYGHMTLALLAQAAARQFRQRLGPPFAHWEAAHLARDLFCGLDGDVRVEDDTIVVTYYNAPNAPALREHYQNLPAKLKREKIDPQIPWLYNFKLDFRFK